MKSSNLASRIEVKEKFLDEIRFFHKSLDMNVSQCVICHQAWSLKTYSERGRRDAVV